MICLMFLDSTNIFLLENYGHSNLQINYSLGVLGGPYIFGESVSAHLDLTKKSVLTFNYIFPGAAGFVKTVVAASQNKNTFILI